jgi:hypothetical protein
MLLSAFHCRVIIKVNGLILPKYEFYTFLLIFFIFDLKIASTNCTRRLETACVLILMYSCLFNFIQDSLNS